MPDPLVRHQEKPPPTRLERWLVRKLQGGSLRTLPRYFPPGGIDGRLPEPFARELLAGLQCTHADPLTVERLKDDGRAFRSWAESAVSHAAHRVADRGHVLNPGFFAG